MKTLKCFKCGKEASYVYDKTTEDIGGYAFDCECGEKIMSPKENPNIREYNS